MLFFVLFGTFGSFVPVFAQSFTETQVRNVSGANNYPRNAPIEEFSNRFPDSEVTVRLGAGRNASDLTYRFRGTFNTATRTVKQNWAAIADFNRSRWVFVLRVCNVGADNRPQDGTRGTSDTCVITQVPDESHIADEQEYRQSHPQLAIRHTEDLFVISPNDGVNYLDRVRSVIESLITKKIYHNTIDIDVASDGQTFDVKNAELESIDMQFQPSASSISKVLESGKKYQADFWYCAATDDGLGSNASNTTWINNWIQRENTDTLRIFGTKCDSNHLAYFRMGGVQFDIPTTQAGIEDANAGYQQAQAENNRRVAESGIMPNCHPLNGWGPGQGSFVGCVAFIAYYAIYWPISWFAGIMGSLFDFFLGYSLDDASYRADFAVRAWQTVRDISNIFFIIILVWTGLAAVFNIGNISMKKVVPALIINALIINFSLFATRVVIDISNIPARLFYNTIQVCDKECVDQNPKDGTPDNLKESATSYKPLSEAIVSTFDPQRIFRMGLLDQQPLSVSSQQTSQTDSGAPEDDDEKDNIRNTNSYATKFIVISLIAALIMFATAMLFWKTAFFFLGRTIGLYVAMIFSPFAFLTRGNIPIFGGIKAISWSGWVKDLGNYAMLAPVFVFFLFIIYSFINSDFSKVNLQSNANETFLGQVIAITVPMLIIYFMVQQGVKIAETFAGSIGLSIQGYANKLTGGMGGVIGGGVGLAAGAVALAGRNVLGRGARLATKSSFGKWAAQNADSSKFARFSNQVMNRAQTGSWDLRNAGFKIGDKDYTAGGTFNKYIGLFGEKPVDKISKQVGLGKEKGKGGIVAIDKERVKKDVERKGKRISYSHLSDDEAKAVWEKKKEQSIKKYGEEKWAEHVETDAFGNKPELTKINNLQKELEQAKKDLDEVNKTGTVYEKTMAQDRVNKASADLALAKDPVMKKAEEEEKKRLEKYGTIKNAKTLETAMRAEYAEDLRKNSFWLADGKARYAPGLISGAFATLTAMIPGAGTLIGALIGKDIAEGLLNSAQGIYEKSTKKMIEDAKKSGRSDKLQRAEDKIERLKDKIAEAVNSANGTKEKYDNFSNEEIEEGIIKRIVQLEDEINSLDKNSPNYKFELRRRESMMRDLNNASRDLEREEDRVENMKRNKKSEEKEDKDKDKDKDKSDDKDKEEKKV